MGYILDKLDSNYQLRRILIDVDKLPLSEKKQISKKINNSIRKTFTNIKTKKYFNTKVFEDNRNLFGYFFYIINGFYTQDDNFIYNGYFSYNNRSYRGLELMVNVYNNIEKKTSQLVQNLNMDYVKVSNIYLYKKILSNRKNPFTERLMDYLNNSQ
jgi:hypothetical protein